VFSISDLERQQQVFWDGVRNYQVRNMFRDQVRVGDKALFYHSSSDTVGVVGEMEIVKGAEPDPTQFDPQSEYFDARSTHDTPRWLGVTVSYVRTFPTLVSLTAMRSEPVLESIPILQKGNRLSVVPLSKKEYACIVRMGTKREGLSRTSV
jgi:predicted RNA-binding protein with PUA-like domain